MIYLKLLWLECVKAKSVIGCDEFFSLNLRRYNVYFLLSAAACALSDNLILRPPQQRVAALALAFALAAGAAGGVVLATVGLVLETGTATSILV